MTVEINASNPYAGMPRFDGKSAPRAAARILEFHGFDTTRQDASGFTAAFARQLEYTYAVVEKLVFSKFKARKLIPVDSAPGPAADTFNYKQLGTVAKNAAIAQSYGDDAPMPQVYGQEFPQRIVSLTASYGYSVQDLRAAALANFPLDATLGQMARDMIERSIEDLAASGSALILQPGGSQQMYGLTNAPNVTATTQVSTLDWIAQYAADTSAGKTTSISQMIADLNAMRIGSSAHPTEGIATKTKNEFGDIGTLSVVFPTILYNFLSGTPRSIQFDSTGQTLLEYLIKTCGYKDADFWNRLDTAGASSKGRTMVYLRDPACVRLVISQEFEQFAPQPRNMGFVIPCHARTGAVQVRQPLAVTYMDGISP